MKMEPYDPKSKRQALQRLQHYVAEDTLSGGYHRSDIKKVIDLIAELDAEVERLEKSNDHHHKQLMNRIRIGNEIKYEVDCENERLRSALDAIISKLRREGCTSRGCDQEIHTMQCPMEVALLLEQALKG
jgi:phosphoenolpyruvate synthase/pyruvate phosphate dikinase